MSNRNFKLKKNCYRIWEVEILIHTNFENIPCYQQQHLGRISIG